MLTETESTISETHTVVTTFLHKSFKPVRIIFPKNTEIYYKNAIFGCWSQDGSVHFYDTQIKTPAVYMVKILDSVQNDFILEEKYGMHILDTLGKIPTRYVYMLKDFFFKDLGTIDYNSKVNYDDTIKYWENVVFQCPLKILKNIVLEAFDNVAEGQSYKIKVFNGPPYFEDRTWYTKDRNHSKTAEAFIDKSNKLYSLGYTPEDTDPLAHYKYRYNQLGAAEGGIKMTYAGYLPWQPVRSHVRYGPFQWKNYHSSCGYLDTRGHDTYDQRKDLSVEEIVVLYEFLKREGADVRVLSINGVKLIDDKNPNLLYQTTN